MSDQFHTDLEVHLDEPPKEDSNDLFNFDSGIATNFTDTSEISKEPVDVQDLLNLNDPPMSDEELIAKKAEEIVDPIVNEAIEQQKELEISEEETRTDVGRKLDSGGDKKSEKSSSDDGFEHVKVDDLAGNSEDLEKLEESKEENPIESDNMNTELKSEIIDHSNEAIEATNDDINEDILSEAPMESIIINDEEKIEEILEDNLKDETTEEHENSTLDVSLTEPPQDDINVEENSNVDYIINSAYEMANKEIPHEYDEHSDDFIESSKLSEPIHSDIKDKQDAEVESHFTKDQHNEEIISNIIHPIQTPVTPIESEQPREEPETEKEEIETLSAKLTDDKHVDEIREKFSRILMWKNPIVSGVILAIVLFLEIALMCDFSVISVLAYCGIFILLANLCCKISSKFNLLSKCPFGESEVDINAADIQYLINCFMGVLEWILKEMKSLTLVESVMKNLKAMVILYFMTYIGEWFNLLSLIFMGTLLLFSVPIFMEKYDREIQHFTRQIKLNFNRNINMIKEKFGMVKKD